MNKRIAEFIFKNVKPMDFPGFSGNEIKIKFKGKKYLLIGNLENGGPIATKKQYKNFTCSFAHLFPDGYIRIFNKIIGNKEDIEILGER